MNTLAAVGSWQMRRDEVERTFRRLLLLCKRWQWRCREVTRCGYIFQVEPTGLANWTEQGEL
jgi:hypothetical protein